MVKHEFIVDNYTSYTVIPPWLL